MWGTWLSGVTAAGPVVHAGAASRPSLAVGAAFDAGGRLWLVRAEQGYVTVSVAKEGGQDFSAPVRVTPEPEAVAADGENRPKIAVAPDGMVLVSWTQTLPQRYSGNVRFSRSIDGGKTFSAPVTLNDDGRVTSHRFDSLAIDGKGRVAVVWLDARDRDAAREQGREFSGVSLYAAESDDGGASFRANRRLAEHVCECCRTATAWGSEGAVVFWRNLYGVNTRDFAIGWLDSGTVKRATDDDWRIDACPHHGGGVAAGDDGALHVVWFTQGQARQGLFYRQVRGAGMTSPMALGNPSAQAGHPAVAAAGKTVLIAWREFDGTAYGTWAMLSRDGGANWGTPQRVATSADAADYPLPLIRSGQPKIVWSTAREGVRVIGVD